MDLSLMNMLDLLSTVHFAHIACHWKFVLLHYTKVLYQYGLYRADYAYLTYLMLQWHLSHLNGHKLDHCLLYFLCLASPCSLQGTCSFSWFCMTSACCLYNLLYNHIRTEGWKLCANCGLVCTLEYFQWCTEPCFACGAIMRGVCC
jgi:hypothetical protein